MKYRAEFFDSDGHMVCMTFGEAPSLAEAHLHEQASCVRHRAVALHIHDTADDDAQRTPPAAPTHAE